MAMGESEFDILVAPAMNIRDRPPRVRDVRLFKNLCIRHRSIANVWFSHPKDIEDVIEVVVRLDMKALVVPCLSNWRSALVSSPCESRLTSLFALLDLLPLHILFNHTSRSNRGTGYQYHRQTVALHRRE